MNNESMIHVDGPVGAVVNGPYQDTRTIVVSVGEIVGSGKVVAGGFTMFLSRSSDCTMIADAFLEAKRRLEELEKEDA